MNKVKLVYIKGSEIGTRKNQSYPLGLMDLKAYASQFDEIKRNIDIDIEILDYEVQDEAFVYDVYEKNYHMVLFSTYIWNISRALEIARKIKIVKPDCYIGLGGPEVNNAYEIVSENSFLDFVARGEGERSFLTILQKFLLGENKALRGVVYRNGKEIFDTGNPDLIEDLDEIPSIVNDSLIKGTDMLLYETSRGCPFQCKYCCWSGQRMRYFSLERVEEDLRILLSNSNATSLFLIDSELDIDINRAKKIMQIIIKQNQNGMIIQGFLGLHVVDSELLMLCKKANFKFGIGIQTVNEIALQQCGRTWFHPNEFEKKLKIVKDYYNVEDIEFQLIMGLPGDDYSSFRENLQWCDKQGARQVAANRLYVLPGSYFYKNADEYGIMFDKAPYHLVYSTNTYSYSDLIRSESLLLAYQTIKHIFGSYSKIVHKDKSLMLWDCIDGYEQHLFRKRVYSQGRQESQTFELEYDYRKEIIESLLENNQYDEAFVCYLDTRITYSRASYYFRRIKEKKGISNNIGIYNYFIYPDIKIDENGIITEYGINKCILLFDYKNKKIKKIVVTSNGGKELISVLDKLVDGISYKEFLELQRKSNMNAIFDYIVKNNIVYNL